MHWFFYHCALNPKLYKAALIRADLEKLDLFGDDYIDDCITVYVQERRYREYITDSLKIIAENTAKFAGGSAPTMRYADIIDPKPKDTRTAEQIVADINTRCGLTMIDDTEEGDL